MTMSTSQLNVGDFLDLDDLQLFQEVSEIDPNVNFGDAPPPPPEYDPNGKTILHLVTPSITLDEKTKKSVKVNKDNKPQFVGVNWKLVADGYPWNGMLLTTWPSCTVRNGTSEVDGIIKAYTGKPGIGLTDQQKMTFLYQQFTSQRPLRVEVRWEASKANPNYNPNRDKGKDNQQYLTIKRGMKNFPFSQERKMFVPLTENPSTGEECRTDARIVAYYPA